MRVNLKTGGIDLNTIEEGAPKTLPVFVNGECVVLWATLKSQSGRNANGNGRDLFLVVKFDGEFYENGSTFFLLLEGPLGDDERNLLE